MSSTLSAPNRARGRRPRVWTFSVVLVIVATVLILPPSAGAYVYWSNYGLGQGTTLGRANLDGTGASQSFITRANIPTGVAVDDQHFYWANSLAGTIGRANLDGTAADRFFITGANQPEGLAVDGRHIYWSNVTGGTIGRANLDGSSPDNDFITGAGAEGVAVDGQHIYWGTGGDAIGRANLDGSAPNGRFVDLTGLAATNGVAVDGGHIYWTSYPGTIGRANLDGGDIDLSFVRTGDANPFGIAVDGQHIYWTNLTASTIGRANLDGSSPDPGFIADASAPAGVAVDSLPDASATSVVCSPAAVLLPTATICTATVTAIAGLNPPTGTVDFIGSGAGSFGPPASCSLITTGAAGAMCQQTFAPAAAGLNVITAEYRGDTFNAASSGTAALSVVGAPPPRKPANSFTLSRAKWDPRHGSLTLIATLPGPGTLRLTGHGIKKATKSGAGPGKVVLTIRAQSRAKRLLRQTGKAKITVHITFTPLGGDPNTKTKQFTLRGGR